MIVLMNLLYEAWQQNIQKFKLTKQRVGDT